MFDSPAKPFTLFTSMRCSAGAGGWSCHPEVSGQPGRDPTSVLISGRDEMDVSSPPSPRKSQGWLNKDS